MVSQLVRKKKVFSTFSNISANGDDKDDDDDEDDDDEDDDDDFENIRIYANRLITSARPKCRPTPLQHFDLIYRHLVGDVMTPVKGALPRVILLNVP